jgi:hypothetical protein
MSGTIVIVHLRFAPNGTVAEIGERPELLSPQQWFNFLYQRSISAYQPFAGGRGVFRIGRAELDALRAEAAA